MAIYVDSEDRILRVLSCCVIGPKGDKGDKGDQGDPGETPADVLKYTAQTLTAVQKQQARANIGALGEGDAYASDIYYQNMEFVSQPGNVEEALDALAQQAYFDSTELFAQYKSQVGGTVVDYLKQLNDDGEPLIADGLYYINEPENPDKTYARLFSSGNYGYLVVETYCVRDGWVYKYEYKLRNGEWTQLKYESLGEESLVELHENDGDGTRIMNVAEPFIDLDAANKKYVDDAIGAAIGDVEDLLAEI